MTQKKNSKQTLVPKLRFPEFRGDGEWNPETGKSLFKQISDKAHNGDLPVLAITQEHGAVPRDLIDYHVTVSSSSVLNYKVVRPGDFIISLRSFQGGIEFSEYTGLCSPAYVILREKKDTVSTYFRHLFKSQAFIRELTKNLEGLRDGKMISFKQFCELYINLPHKSEQQKIADCLGSLDELITAHREKLTALQDHKKGLLQKLFPAEGQTTPELRFPGFEGEWETANLGDLCRLKAGKFVPASEIFELSHNGVYPCYGGNGLRGFTASYNHNGQYALIGRQGAHCGNVQLATGRFHATEHAVVVYPEEAIRTDWIFYALIRLNLNRFATGQAQPGLSVEVLQRIPTTFPSIEEQQKIASCLSALDDLISAQTAEIEALQQHKQGLMQQLFPNPEDSAA